MANGIDGLTQREEDLVALVSRALHGFMLDTQIVDVHKQEGGMTPTIRFTLEEQASTDLERSVIAESSQSEEELVRRVVEDLQLQLPRR